MINNKYQIKKDIDFILEAEKINKNELSEIAKISRITLEKIYDRGVASNEALEKLYSFIYKNNYRINTVKEEFIKEKYTKVLFHGSKNGIKNLMISGSRANCDFGTGFYLGENYNQALSFVCEYDNSSVYSFKYAFDGLKQVKFKCSLDWMIAICYYRGTIREYSDSKIVKRIIKKIEEADIIVAPIADNKMFYIMSQFAQGEINADVALHSLSASNFGLQYVIKTEKALKRLVPIEKYYLSIPEKEDSKKAMIKRGYEIDTKLKLAKREFKNGLYVEELLK